MQKATTKAIELDTIDRALLDRIQSSFPLTERPYAALGELVGTSEDDVLERMARLKEARIVRQVSAIFDTRNLGYTSMLVAAKIPPERLQAGAEAVNSHPGVSHNYRRNHAFNLWYTVAVPPGADLEAHVAALHQESGAESTRMLPTLRMFKIGVVLDMMGGQPADAKGGVGWERPEEPPPPPTEEEIRAILPLQEDLPLEPEPFAKLASEFGTTAQHLLAMAEHLTKRQLMRRYSAVLHHRRAGFGANGMAVWRVPSDRATELGPKMAAFAKVSHCYQRPVYSDWPYSVFTMIHGRSKDEVEAVVAAIQQETGISEHAVLYSTKEYKKIRLRYFDGQIEAWAAARGL